MELTPSEIVTGICTLFATGFGSGIAYCASTFENKVETSCDIKDKENQKHIKTFLKNGYAPNTIPAIKVSLRNKKPYHCDCSYFDMKTKKCRINPDLQKCKLL